ncbi:ArsR/SmtB family transcription factor [Janthinobacterium psychrotolerans]|uniref:DNA-binding transcriptional regulator, ArsR family n=1 Tax=Janthinobacterium psychrotolerans TaxID=1747903 RepID=A0A1A7BVF5_9BURK|nr:metalloregulator ArsR/SmtB family transcription factor [Janthinobacterium psychrotolerans]OBV37546.1 DNA-binding transcriptional regulator, ArsR family [Janthinobacterium psychrotolerans]
MDTLQAQELPAPLNLDAMRASAYKASALLKAMGNADRLMLLCQLTHGEHCVSDLEQRTGIGQPTLSQQLGVLREDMLVATRRDGKQIYYRVASPAVLAVLQVLYAQFCAPRPVFNDEAD